MAGFGSHEDAGAWRVRERMFKALRAWNRRRVQQRRVNKLAPDYAAWIRQNEQQRPPTGAALKISIVMPVFRPDLAHLRAAVQSILAQSHANWELCIADDASGDAALTALLTEMAQAEPRIKVHVRTENGHIAAASNDALRMATGEWVILCDQDDLLAVDALAWVAAFVAKDPQVAFWYSDRDKVTDEGQRYEPFFKPGFGQEMLLAQNYLCHLVAMRLDVLLEIGGFRPGFDGAQDHDLFLRYIAKVGGERVGHIPRVLYHWRAHSGSTALSLGNKSYASEAGVKAVADHVAQAVPGARACWDEKSSTIRVSYPLPDAAPLVSIVIPTRDRLDLLKVCVESVLSKTRYRPLELIIVDNGSAEAATLDYLQQLVRAGTARVLRDDGPFNYSRLNNRAAREASGEFLLLLNNDVEVMDADWLSEMVSLAVRPHVGCVGAKLLYPDGRIQHGGLVTGVRGVATHVLRGRARDDRAYFNWLNITHEVAAVTGACLLVPKALFLKLGGLDEEHLAVAFNDVDLCLKVRELGYAVIYAAHAVLIHHESVSRGLDSEEESVARWRKEVHHMKKRWAGVLECDPYYNPNLSRHGDGFEFALKG